jgi:hypothetical protein
MPYSIRDIGLGKWGFDLVGLDLESFGRRLLAKAS